MDQIREDLRIFIAYRVRQGFASPQDIIEEAAEYAFETYGRDDLITEIERMTNESIAHYQVGQATWPATTDCDRLTNAFTALNRRGIVAREDFSCCNNCGHTEIWDEIEEEEERQTVSGYVFYHSQCTDLVMESGRLLLAYGCVEESAEALASVTSIIADELQRAGLNVTEQGSDGQPIVVEGIVWRKRRVELSAEPTASEHGVL